MQSTADVNSKAGSRLRRIRSLESGQALQDTFLRREATDGNDMGQCGKPKSCKANVQIFVQEERGLTAIPAVCIRPKASLARLKRLDDFLDIFVSDISQ